MFISAVLYALAETHVVCDVTTASVLKLSGIHSKYNSHKDYRIPKTCHWYSFEWGKMQRSIWPLYRRKPQSLIGKVSASLQLPLEVVVTIETVSALRHALRTAHAHWLI